MKKFLLLILAILIHSIILYADKMSLPGPYGGSVTANCGDISQTTNGDFIGSCIIFYDNYSTIPGWAFNGSFSINVTTSIKKNELFLEFDKNSKFNLKELNNNFNHVIYFPEKVSFTVNIQTLQCIEVKSLSKNNAILKFDAYDVNIEPQFLHYFFHIFN